MLISWMAYALALSLCAAVVGLALDRLSGIWGAPRRWAWIAALFATVAAPPMLAIRPPPPPAIAQAVAHTSTTAIAQLPWTAIAIAIWCIGTLVCLGLIVRDVLRVHRRRAHWRRAHIDGVFVFLSDDDGPAVVGLRRPAIVLPAWTVTLTPHQRSLMLRHEREHVAAGDHRIAFAAALAVTLLPWCVGLWWIARRLRLAIEIDCDARVLRATANPREYGLLLIAVGARQSLSLPFAMALAELPPLEERILAMTMVRPSRPAIASAPFAMLGIIAIAVMMRGPVPPPLARATHAVSPAVARVAERRAVVPITTPATPEPLRSVVAVRAEPRHTPVAAAPRRLVVASQGNRAGHRGSRILVDLQDLQSDRVTRDQSVRGNALQSKDLPMAVFVPRSVDGLATTAGVDSAPFSMVGDLTVHGVTRPVTWVGSARSRGDTARGTARTAIAFEDFGLAAPRTAMLGARDSIRLEYDFDFVNATATVKH